MKKKARFKTSDLMAKITDHIQNLADATDVSLVSDAMIGFLDSCSKFHRYSYYNQFSILLSNPNATFVAGYKQWPHFNRYVKKGEEGIPILAPMMFKVDPDDPDNKAKELGGFKVVYVFDISQTDGEDLPDAPEWKSPERNKELHRKLIEFAISNKIIVTEKLQTNGAQGRSLKGSIEIDPSAGTKTLVHEIAHELMHKESIATINTTIKELEAEAVAYVVCKHFGLEELSSPNYIALSGANSELILAHLDRIRTTAAQIIQSVY